MGGLSATSETTGAHGRASEAKRYRTLLEITNAVISNLTREALFHSIFKSLRRVVSSHRGAIFLRDGDKNVLRLAALDSNVPSEGITTGLEIPAEKGHVGYAFRTQSRLLRRDLARERSYRWKSSCTAKGYGLT